MKPNKTKNNWLRPAIASLALASAATLGQAQTFVNPKTFDTGIGSWITWNGWGIQGFLSWDAANDATSNPASGSLRYDVPFTGATGEQFMTFGTFADRWGWDGGTKLNVVGNYKNLVLDLKMDPATVVAKNGNYGSIRLGLTTDGWGQAWLGYYNLPAPSAGWTHVVIPIDQAIVGLDKANGYCINMWSDGNYTNTLSFNVDNIWLQPMTNEPPPPPPMTGIKKAGLPGVEVIMDDDSAQWQRNGIATPAAGGPYLWSSQGSYPVTYSMTITNFPDAATHPGFEAHMYLANQDTADNNQTSGSPDWGVADILIMRIENRSDGDVTAQIQWKTNFPNANATNVPVLVTGPTAVGTWTLTFTDSTHGSMSGPGITETNFTLPEDAVLLNFSRPASFLQFGMFKNDGANDGHNNGASGTFSHVKFTGAAATSFEDDFTGSTLTNKYAWRKTSNTAVQYVTADAMWLVSWTLPAVEFSGQIAPTPTGPWTNALYSGTPYAAGGKMHATILKSDLPAGNSGYFRMMKRGFAKLQVLLPGETADPTSPTGKTGTPTAQQAFMPFTVVVNAVSDDWHVITSVTDTVHLISNDPASFWPTDLDLANGTATFADPNGFTILTPGTWTITASDVTDPTKTGTSSPVVVTP